MTEQERNHLLRMVKHAEKVRKQMALERARPPLTPRELADAIIDSKKKHPNDFPA